MIAMALIMAGLAFFLNMLFEKQIGYNFAVCQIFSIHYEVNIYASKSDYSWGPNGVMKEKERLLTFSLKLFPVLCASREVIMR